MTNQLTRAEAIEKLQAAEAALADFPDDDVESVEFRVYLTFEAFTRRFRGHEVNRFNGEVYDLYSLTVDGIEWRAFDRQEREKPATTVRL